MRRISSLTDFIGAIGPHLMTDSPLDSLRAAGHELDGEVAAALVGDGRMRSSRGDVMTRLRATYGELPATLHIGPLPQEPPPTSTTGYAAVATVDLAVLNEVLTELHRVHTFPHGLTADQTEQVVTLATLRALCTGVPDDAEMGVLQFTGPPVASASKITQLNLHLDLECVIRFASATAPAVFIGVVGLELPLDFQVISAVVRPSHGAIERLTGSLEIGAFSGVRPRSDQARQELEAAFESAARKALLFLSLGALSFTVSIPVHKSRFPKSFIDITQMGVVTIRQSGRDYAVIGTNVERTREVNPIGLIGQLTPVSPHNLRAVVDQEFASDALSSVITSGDLAAFFNRVIDRHSPVNLADVEVRSGRIALMDGRLRVSLDCVVVDGCAFGKDLKFTATLLGTPTVQNGTLAIATSSVDFNVDNTDAVVCAILGAFLGPFGIAVYAGAIAFLAAFNPSSSDLNIPVAETSDPLPGSDKVVDLELTRAAMSPGVLTADGNLRLITDPLRIYVYLRVVEPMRPRMTAPIAGATVELFELDNPAPAGDDVADPTSYTETFTPILETTEEVVYTPRADELLGVGTTGDDGRVTFVVIGNTIGGTATRTRVEENFRTGRVTVTTRREMVGEGLPDLAVTIRSASGELLAQRRLIGLNVSNKRLGRFDQPVDIKVQPRPVRDPGPF